MERGKPFPGKPGTPEAGAKTARTSARRSHPSDSPRLDTGASTKLESKQRTAPRLKSAANGANPSPPTSRARTGRRESNPLAPERVEAILDALARAYPDAECALLHLNPWELLVATILSAQSTDARVNMVTPGLFKKFPTPASMAKAPLLEIEKMIQSTGFYHNKAKFISGAARRITEQFKGRTPQTMDELLTLPGVARKTANVVLGVAFKKAEGIVVDTHVLRLSRRLELTTATDPKRVEVDLMKIVPASRWIAFSHELIHHGRRICIARKPRCADCPLETLCNASDKTWSTH